MSFEVNITLLDLTTLPLEKKKNISLLILGIQFYSEEGWV